MSKLQTILEDLSAGIHASFKDENHKYCEEHIAEAKAEIIDLIISEMPKGERMFYATRPGSVRAISVDELNKVLDRMKSS